MGRVRHMVRVRAILGSALFSCIFCVPKSRLCVGILNSRLCIETYGYLLPLVRTTRLRRPVVSATVCFVTAQPTRFTFYRWDSCR